MPLRRLTLGLSLCACLALFSGCGDTVAESNPQQSQLLPAHVEGTTFRDSMGRQLLLRGYNARAQGIFDVTFDDGRTALEDVPAFAEPDAQRLEELGLNVLRLPVNWSGLEPQPQQYSEMYMQRIDAILALGRRHRFYVLIDMHQDAYSKEIGEDGAPLWAIVPAPTRLLQGPLTDLESRRSSPQVLAAFASFFRNRPGPDGRGLQDAFVAAVQQLVKRYAGDPVVIGYEALNEPVIFNDAPLDVFHQRLAAGVHAIDPQVAIFFEPTGLRNSVDKARIPAAPWANGPGVYAPHIYTTIFSPPFDGWASEDPTVLAPSMESATQEAQGWGTPLFVGEFGTDQSVDRGHRWLEAELDLQDRFLASSTVWVWRETGVWGLLDSDGNPRQATVRAVSRPFPRALAGDLVAIERPAPGVLRVRYRDTATTAGLAHEVSASADHLGSFEIRCDGGRVPVTQFTGRAQFACPHTGGEHVFELAGTVVGGE